MEPLIATFHIDWKIIIAQAINFGVVFAVLYVYALKPLSKLMEERSEKIARGITDAKQNKAMLENSVKQCEIALHQAHKEAQSLFEEGKRDAEAKKEQMLAEAKAEVENIIANGKKTLEAEKVKMVSEAKGEIVSLVMLATEKLTNSHDPKLQEKAINELKSL